MEGKDRGGARWRGKGKEGEGPAVGGILLQGFRGIDAPAFHRPRSRLAIGTSRHTPPPQLHRRLDAFCPGTRNIKSAPMMAQINVAFHSPYVPRIANNNGQTRRASTYAFIAHSSSPAVCRLQRLSFKAGAEFGGDPWRMHWNQREARVQPIATHCEHFLTEKTVNPIEDVQQESLANAKVSAQQQCMYEGP